MIRSYKSQRRGFKAKAALFYAIARNTLIIILLCFAVKFLSDIGADSFIENQFARLMQNETVISTILGLEFGYTERENDDLMNVVLGGGDAGKTSSEEPAESDTGDTIPSVTLPNGESGGLSSSTSATPQTEFNTLDDFSLEAAFNAGVSGAIQDLSGLDIDFSKYLEPGTSLSTDYSDVTVLIIHTHGSEAYKPDGDDVYIASDPSRTEDNNYNMIRVGNELTSILQSRGISVIHDTSLYDYPSYNGSYTRSLEAIVSYLEADPTIKIVIDLHRDAVNEGDDPYKTVVDINGEPSSQVMIIAGTNGTGLYHPLWEENLKFALLLQGCMNMKYPSLARPLYVTNARYNQHATTGSLIVEVGYNGNTLQEALRGVSYFADCMADVVTSLTENSVNTKNG